MRYLQDLRMGRVRADLRIAEPGMINVATIARRWGYFHLGRFFGVYRERFGEFPKDTLHS